MLEADWLFETRDGCCAVNTCPDEGTTTTTEATTTQVSSTTTTEVSTTQVSSTTSTEASTTQVSSTTTTEATTVSPSDDGRWLFNEAGTDCVFMILPASMLDASWVFETRDGCCAVKTCPDEGTTTTTEATTTQEPVTTTTTSASTTTTTEASTTQVSSTTTTKATTTQEFPPRWYPHLDSYDEVRLGCCANFNKCFY